MLHYNAFLSIAFLPVYLAGHSQPKESKDGGDNGNDGDDGDDGDTNDGDIKDSLKCKMS